MVTRFCDFPTNDGRRDRRCIFRLASLAKMYVLHVMKLMYHDDYNYCLNYTIRFKTLHLPTFFYISNISIEMVENKSFKGRLHG